MDEIFTNGICTFIFISSCGVLLSSNVESFLFVIFVVFCFFLFNDFIDKNIFISKSINSTIVAVVVQLIIIIGIVIGVLSYFFVLVVVVVVVLCFFVVVVAVFVLPNVFFAELSLTEPCGLLQLNP